MKWLPPLLLVAILAVLAVFLWQRPAEAPGLDPGPDATTASSLPEAASSAVEEAVERENTTRRTTLSLLDESEAPLEAEAELLIWERNGSLHQVKVTGGQHALGAPLPAAVAAHADGKWSTLTLLDEEAADATLELRLDQPELELHITAVDGNGQLLPNATMSLQAKGRGAERWQTWLDATTEDSLERRLPPLSFSAKVELRHHVPAAMEIAGRHGGRMEEIATLLPAAAVEGLILDADGPVAGAIVGLWPKAKTTNLLAVAEQRFLDDGELPGAIPDEHRAITDADGHYLLDPVRPGSYQLMVSHRDYLPTLDKQLLELTPGPAVKAADLTLASGLRLRVLVHAPDGQPLADAKLRWNRGGEGILSRLAASESRDQGGGGRQQAVTDAQGRATLSALPARLIELRVEHPDYALYSQELDLTVAGDSTRELDITLAAAASLRVQLVDALSRDPVEGADLRLLASSEADALSAMLPFAEHAEQSDAQGWVSFDNLAAGDYVAVASEARYLKVQQEVSVVEGANAPIELRLHPGATLHVKVLDEEDLPTPGVTVVATNLEAQDTRQATTDELGEALLQGMHGGRWQVQAIASSNLRAASGGSLEVQLKFVDLEEGEETELVLGGRQRRADVEGHLWRGNEALGGASVAVILRSGVKVATADAEGAYRLEGIPLGDYVAIINAGGIGGGGGNFYDGLTVDQEGSMVHDFHLPEDGLEIHVVDAHSGEALQGVSISVRPQDGSNISGGDFGSTDQDGIARFPSLVPGTYLAFAGSVAVPFLGNDDRGLGSVASDPILVSKGSGLQRVELRLQQGATLRIRVRDADGNLLKGAHMHYATADGQAFNVVSMKGTNSKGVAEMKNLPAGPGHLIVRHPTLGYQEVPVQLKAGELSKLEVQLDRGSLIYVTPLDADGQPMAGVLCSAVDERGSPLSYLWALEETQATNAAYFGGGEQKLGPLPAGHYTILMIRPGSPKVRHEIEVDGHSEQHLSLPFTADAR